MGKPRTYDDVTVERLILYSNVGFKLTLFSSEYRINASLLSKFETHLTRSYARLQHHGILWMMAVTSTV